MTNHLPVFLRNITDGVTLTLYDVDRSLQNKTSLQENLQREIWYGQTVLRLWPTRNRLFS